MFSAAWHSIRAVISHAPKLYGALRAERLFEAVPTLMDPARPDEDFVPSVVVLPTSGPSRFATEFAARMSLTVASRIGDVLLLALVEQPSLRFGRCSSGLCSCGRRALILARCTWCAKEDLDEVAEGEDEDPVPEIASVDSSLRDVWMGGTAVLVSPHMVVHALQDGAPHIHVAATGVTVTRQPAVTEAVVTILPRPAASHPYRMLFLFLGGLLALVQDA